MALIESHKVGWINIFDASFIDFPGRDHSGLYQFPQP
jgi:hypothetical protein